MSSCNNDTDGSDLKVAARKFAALFNSLKGELECGICHEVMTDVRRVTCGHWFDLPCIEEAIKNKPAGQRNGACPDCGHGINKRSLKEDDQFQAIADIVREAHALTEEYGLQSVGQQEDMNSSSGSATDESVASSSSSSSQESTPEKPKRRVKGGKYGKTPVSKKGSKEQDEQPVEAVGKTPSAKEPKPRVTRSQKAKSQESVPQNLEPSMPVMDTPPKDDSLVLDFDDLADKAFADLDGNPHTPDISFETLVKECQGEEEEKAHPTSTPIEQFHSLHDSIAGSVISHKSFADPDASHAEVSRRLFDQSQKSNLSDSSSDEEEDEAAAASEADAAAAQLDQFRSAGQSPAAPANKVTASLSDLSKESSDPSQFFKKWPYTKSPGSELLDEGSEETETARHPDGQEDAVAAGVQNQSNGGVMSPIPSFLGIMSPLSQGAVTPARVSSQGTQTSPVAKDSESGRISLSFNESSRRRSCSNEQLQGFMRSVLEPTLREVLTDVISKQQSQ